MPNNQRHSTPTGTTGAPPGYWGRAWLCVTSVLAGCATAPGLHTTKAPPPEPSPGSVPANTATEPAPPVAPIVQAPKPVPAQRPEAPPSQASSLDQYRRDAAAHLYTLNQDRIYRGQLPPLLYAVGVVEVNLDRQGQVRDVRWLRAPNHAPEVMDDIVKTIKAAAPFPAPRKMGQVSWTETWLWHKSGRFQLHSLTEGQL